MDPSSWSIGISASRRGCSQQFWEALLVLRSRCQPWLVKKGVGEDVAMLIFIKNPAAMGRNSTLIAQLFSSEWTIQLDRWAAPLASHHLEETLAAQKKKVPCGSVSKPCTPVVHIKIAGKWMFIPLKMVLIGIDPYPCVSTCWFAGNPA